MTQVKTMTERLKELGITIAPGTRLRARIRSWRRPSTGMYHGKIEVLVGPDKWIKLREVEPSCSEMALRVGAAAWCGAERLKLDRGRI